ncbi:hypothetical protein [Microbacterium lacticum]
MASVTSKAKSVLFLSADLVGSTSYKQKSPGWQKIFLQFYREFPQRLNTENRDYEALHGIRSDFTLWKAIGDELIFSVDVKKEADVSAALRVWLSALKAYEDDSLEEVQLGLKGGAFIATFPGPDSESSIPKRPETEKSDESVVFLNDKALAGRRADTRYLFDYFGPSIDTGFRISGLASKRYFTMTVEVAWALAREAHAQESSAATATPHHVDDVVFRGRELLKGVWNGQEYPLFAIDRDYESPVNIALAKLNGPAITAKHITHVCEACYDSDGWPSRLYLPDSDFGPFQCTPGDAMQDLRDTESTVALETKGLDRGDALGDNPPLG